MQNYYKQFDTCREHDIPTCADACPFKMDVLTIQDRIAKGRFNAAYKSIRDCVAVSYTHLDVYKRQIYTIERRIKKVIINDLKYIHIYFKIKQSQLR